MRDKELLELAAKAAGIGPVLCYEAKRNLLRIGDRKCYRLWRPLNNYEDAFRLAISLGATVYTSIVTVHIWADDVNEVSATGEPSNERGQEVCRAIVCAAAAVGEKMP